VTDGLAMPLLLALAGLLLSPAAEFLIARTLPRLGGLPDGGSHRPAFCTAWVAVWDGGRIAGLSVTGSFGRATFTY